ncbi:MAG: leucyl aminopeptidase [Bacteroidales bacterium]|nr:leucyl aminopeptidase [Bacteroidales bacterium]
MATKLVKITEIPENSSLAVLVGDAGRLPVALTGAEKARWEALPPKTDFLLLHRLPEFILLVRPHSGKEPAALAESFRKAGAAWAETIRREKSEKVAVIGDSGTAATLAFAEGFLLGGYTFSRYKKEKEDFMPGTLEILDEGITVAELEELETVAAAVCWARDLVNEPLSRMTAADLAGAVSIEASGAGVTTEVFHRQKIEALKMGGLLAVNRGSVDPPTFTVMEYKPEGHLNDKPVVLVGKGVVFDTGGLSLKPTPKSMDYMKSDMAGAAAIAAALVAAARNRLPLYLVGLIPATDNRPDGNAITPGDVITMYDGTTVEVLNTDAEGRLILADALSYARKYDPMLVIDVATLTGGASIIAGSHGICAMSEHPEWMEPLRECGEEVYERIVELPLWEEFAQPLKSDIADLSNLGSREGQTIVAGHFLRHFTAYPWIHLDIAGPAFLFERDGYRPKGATGCAVRLLYRFLKRIK